MTISLTHALVAVGTEAGNGEVEREAWNDEHAITMASSRLLGRTTAATGAVEEISVGTGLSFSSGALDAAPPGIISETADFTFALSDANGTIVASSASAIIATIPTNAAIAYPIGTKLRVNRAGAGSVKVSPDTGVTLRLPTGIKPKRFMGAKALHAGATGLNYTGWTAIPFAGTDVWDTDDFHDPSSNNTRMTLPAGLGIKKVSLDLQFSANNDTADRWSAIGFYANGATNLAYSIVERGAGGLELHISALNYEITSGYIEARVITEFDTSIDPLAASYFMLEVTEIDAQGFVAYQYGAIEIQKIGTNEWIVSDQSALG